MWERQLCVPAKALLAMLLLAILLLAMACGPSDPCPGSEQRPGWNESSGTPQLPFLPPPARHNRAGGCSRSEGDRVSLGCPVLVNGEPPLSANLDPAKASGRGTYFVRMFTSPDARQWTMTPEPLAHSFSSLGLMTTESHLYLFGSSQIPVYTPHAVVTALRTSDLRHWEGCAWNICREVNKGLVDTQPSRMPDGSIRLWYYSVPNPPGKTRFDPARMPGVHTMVFADLYDHRFFARGVGYADANLADPDVVYFRERWWMAVSRNAQRVVLAGSDDGEHFRTTGKTFDGVSVPYLFLDGNELWLLAQRDHDDGHGRGLPWPYLFVTRDGRTWEERGYLFREQPAGGCTSPVMAWFREQYVLFCSTFQAPGAE